MCSAHYQRGGEWIKKRMGITRFSRGDDDELTFVGLTIDGQ